ncbi:hypothetical protein EVA_09470 [gut metagenome]|uniref:Uncharacterized protein n=1 Tax=gut metagenome TaxID=749906 RepID=J9G6C2_9ZZZZ
MESADPRSHDRTEAHQFPDAALPGAYSLLEVLLL